MEEKPIKTLHDQPDNYLVGNGELILIVDDNTEVRTTLREVLESIGYQTIEAENGLQAIDQFKIYQDSIALIIMDIVMPKMGGLKAVEAIRSINPDVKVIFASGYDKDDALKNEMPSDDQLILSKPYNLSKLSQIIRNELGDL